MHVIAPSAQKDVGGAIMWCSTPPSLRRASFDVVHTQEDEVEATAESTEEDGRTLASEDEGEAASFATAAASEVRISSALARAAAAWWRRSCATCEG